MGRRKTNTLQYHIANTIEPVPSLISSLGYCCVAAFFARNQDTMLIALRLGVSKRAVRRWKARAKAGKEVCRGKEGCLRARLEAGGFTVSASSG
jgi:hypothetical protein